MPRYSIGDIHGRYDAFIKCLDAVNFNIEKDELITLGDIFDYNDGVCETIDLLKHIKGVRIAGNHDVVFKIWVKTKNHLYNWSNGGKGTLDSYSKYLGKDFCFYANMIYPDHIPQPHVNFLNSLKDYHITDDGIMFCHAGFNTEYCLEDQLGDEFFNNRSLFKNAKKGILDLSKHPNIKKIFIGHTITDDYKPFISDRLINLDTGAKSDKGYLTIMNIDTLEYHSQKI